MDKKAFRTLTMNVAAFSGCYENDTATEVELPFILNSFMPTYASFLCIRSQIMLCFFQTSLLFHQRQKNNKFVIGGGKYNLNDDVGLVKFSERLYHYLRLTISSE